MNVVAGLGLPEWLPTQFVSAKHAPRGGLARGEVRARERGRSESIYDCAMRTRGRRSEGALRGDGSYMRALLDGSYMRALLIAQRPCRRGPAPACSPPPLCRHLAGRKAKQSGHDGARRLSTLEQFICHAANASASPLGRVRQLRAPRREAQTRGMRGRMRQTCVSPSCGRHASAHHALYACGTHSAT